MDAAQKQQLEQSHLSIPRQLETNFMIEEDMQVTIIHHSTHISVQMEGIALEEGQYGDWISVKNIKSGRIILAKVIDEKKVSI